MFEASAWYTGMIIGAILLYSPYVLFPLGTFFAIQDYRKGNIRNKTVITIIIMAIVVALKMVMFGSAI